MEPENLSPSCIWKKISGSDLLDEDDTAVIYYSISQLKERLHNLRCIFNEINPLHTVAIKTNPHKYILESIVKQGFGLEAASFEEVQMAVNAGTSYEQITYNSPIKTHREIAYCEANYPKLRLNANSFEELGRISRKSNLNIGLRINPLVHAGSEEIYDVSGDESKFGVSINQEQDIIENVIRYSVNTLHVHVGSQVADIQKVVEAITKVITLANLINFRCVESGKSELIKWINIGGGIPAGINNEASFQIMRSYADMIKAAFKDLKARRYQIITEFGQWVHKHNGVVFSRVEYIKKINNKHIAYVHVGADLYMREVYTNINKIEFICLSSQGELLTAEKEIYDIAGPLCFNGDYLGKNILLPHLKVGDIIAIPSSGANNYGLWSRHCSRDIPAMWSEEEESNELIKVSDRTKSVPSH